MNKNICNSFLVNSLHKSDDAVKINQRTFLTVIDFTLLYVPAAMKYWTNTYGWNVEG